MACATHPVAGGGAASEDRRSGTMTADAGAPTALGRARRELSAVLFDVDGTLVESERDGHRVAFNEAFAEAGLPDRWDVPHYRELLAVTGGEARLLHYFATTWGAADAAPVPDADWPALAKRLHRVKTERFQAMVLAGRIPLRAGVRRLVDELTSAGIRLGVVTTGSPEWVEPLLAGHFGPGRFAVVVTGREVPILEPDPSAYLLALARLEADPEAVLAVEDSGPGLAAATAAGIACVVTGNDETRFEEVTSAPLVLEGLGEPDSPASVRADPHGVFARAGGAATASTAVVDLAALRRLHAALWERPES